MRTLMSAAAFVHYGQIYVASGPELPDMAECFGGQRNGLCGAAVPGFLFLITGLHTGEVGFTVELHEGPPPVDDGWQEIVEVPFRPAGEVALAGWGGQGHWSLDLTATSYRVRYCATGMDEGRDLDTRMETDPETDCYLLQFWPAPPDPDTVIKQTSEIAAYWHDFASQQPPPPPAPEEIAAAEERARAEQERAEEQMLLGIEQQRWGGRLPSDRLRQAGGNAAALARLDRSLVGALAEADPVTQRTVARWVTRRAFAEAQLTGIDWIAAALDAMDRAEPLPPPFDGDNRRAWDQLFADERVPHTLITALDGRHTNCLQQAFTFPAIFSARETDPLRAALEALWSAAAGFGLDRYEGLFGEVRQAFPALAGTGA